MDLSRRQLMLAGAIGWAAPTLLLPQRAEAADEAMEVVERFTGRTATESDRVHLVLPPEFPTGYTVPLELDVDSPMTEADHVRSVRVFAPRNPIIEVVRFRFVPGRSAARVSTRIRLAGPQSVVAVAEMNDDALLMAKVWVDVATNGCA